MDAIGAQELPFPALLPREPYEASNRWTDVRRRHLPAQGPQGRRLPARAHPRGDVHARGEGPVLLLQGPAGLALPDPDQVPRRGASPRRHAARPRVHHEGLLLLRHRRRGPRRVATPPTARRTSRPSTGSASTTSSSRRPAARWAGRSPRSSSPRPRSARTPTSAAPTATTPRTSRPSRCARPRPWRTTTRPAAHAEQTPDTPTIDTLVDHLNEKFPRDDRPWAAGDTLKNVLVVLKHPDGTREPLAIGVPGDREVDQKRLEGQLEPIEVEPIGRGRASQAPGAGQGLHRPRRAGGGVGVAASATSSTRASSRAPAGSPAPTSTAAT